MRTLLLLVACSWVACFEMDGHVLVLGDADFDSAVKAYPYLLVEFYAPWCTHW